MTKFRPCIDLHDGKVKQIVGGTLRDDGSTPKENFVAGEPSSWFAGKFRDDELRGGHVIMLGPGNEESAREALRVWPGGLQVGGGITPANAAGWLEAGASHVIVTSWLFDKNGGFVPERLSTLAREVGSERIVVDLSARLTPGGWTVAMNRWQTLTDLNISVEVLERLAESCAEFLVHGADVEGLCQGVDLELVALLGSLEGHAITYAGGVRSIDDLRLVEEASGGRVDITVGSALDIFGGSGLAYRELLDWNAGKR